MDEFEEFGGFFGMLFGDVGGFTEVFGEIEKFGGDLVREGDVGLNEFPIADLDGAAEVLFVMFPIEMRVFGLFAFS